MPDDPAPVETPVAALPAPKQSKPTAEPIAGHLVQCTLSLPSADAFSDAVQAIWDAGGFCRPVQKFPSAVHVVYGSDTEVAVKAAFAEVTELWRAKLAAPQAQA